MFLNYRTPRSFDPQEREAHYIFADLAALAIQKAHAQRQQLRLERENLAWLVHDQSKADAATITRLAEDLLADPALGEVARRKLRTIKRSIQSIYNDFEFLQGTLQDIPTDNLQFEVSKILRRVHDAYGIAIDPLWEGDDTLVPPALTYQLRLIANEAIMNAVRHGRATTLRFACQIGPAAVTATIRDDGRGFDPELVRPRGLLHMQQRAARLGGACVVRSAPGQGATVQVCLPLGPILMRSEG
jgi:signal transduction histidine kinase